MARKGFKQTGTRNQYMNDMVFTDYLYWLRSICLTMYKWHNLPKTVNAKYLERTLYYKGKAVFFYDSVLGALALPCDRQAPFDQYGDSKLIRAFSENDTYRATLKQSECTVIYNNTTDWGDDITTRIYAERLYNLTRAQDVNIEQQKTPNIIQCTEQQRLSYINFERQRRDNEMSIFVDEDFQLAGMKVHSTLAPFITDKLEVQKHNVINEFFTRRGIENSSTDKKERLVSTEVNGNDGGIEQGRNAGLRTRQEACDEINDKFKERLEDEVYVTVDSSILSMLNQLNVKKNLSEEELMLMGLEEDNEQQHNAITLDS